MIDVVTHNWSHDMHRTLGLSSDSDREKKFTIKGNYNKHLQMCSNFKFILLNLQELLCNLN